MRVLYLEAPSGYGGSMQSLLELVTYLDKSIEPVIACSYDVEKYRPLPERVRLVRFHPPKAWGVHGYMRLLTHQVGWYRVVGGLLREVRPDLLHFNNVFFGTFGGAIVAKQRGLPVVAHARGFVQSRKLAHRVIHYFDHHITVSKAVADNLIAHGVPEQRVSVVYDPAVVPAIGKSLTRSESPICVGMAAMLQEWKGQHVFIDALHGLEKRGVEYRAIIAGSEPFGARGYEQRLRQMVADYGIAHKVEFTGFVSDPFSIYALLHVNVHASVEPEPLARAAIEAMLCGIATIATNGGGMPELVEDNVTGLLVPMGDAKAMADALERLIKDEVLRQRLAEAGQRRAREMFNPVKHAREVERVYGRLRMRRDAPVL